MLPRQPGSRESRFAHLLGGPVAAAAVEGGHTTAAARNEGGAKAAVETRLEAIEARIEARLSESMDWFVNRIASLEARVDALEKNKL
jgi:uncharacterized protein YceH (UPF0502 family)